MIKVNNIRHIDDKMQVVFFTLTYKDVEYPWAANTPILEGSELQQWLDARKEHYCFSTLFQMYPRAELHGYSHYFDNTETVLEAIEEWIEDGCMLRDPETGLFTGHVEKVPWEGSHPKERLLDRSKISKKTRQQHRDALALDADISTSNQKHQALRAQIQVLQDIIFGREV